MAKEKIINIIGIISLLILFYSCSSRDNLLDTTSYYYNFFEDNLDNYKKYIVKNHLQESEYDNYINQGTIQLYEILDSAALDILAVSGGYNMNGEMIGANKTALGLKVFEKREVISKLNSTVKFLEEKQRSNPVYKGDSTIRLIKSALYIYIGKDSPFISSDDPVAKSFFELMVVQDKLLKIETIYYEGLGKFAYENTNYSKSY